MNAQDKVVAFLTGEMSASEFISELKSDRLLRYYISKIVPDDAVSNVRHPYWNYYSYSGLKSFKFDAWKHICHICRFNKHFGICHNIVDYQKLMVCSQANGISSVLYYIVLWNNNFG